MSQDLIKKNSFLFGSNAPFIEEIYEKYLENPSSVDSSWQIYFDNLGDTTPVYRPSSRDRSESASMWLQGGAQEQRQGSTDSAFLKAKFMIQAYRERGHLLAKLDPLGLEKTKTHQDLRLNIENFGFTHEELSKKIDINGEFNNLYNATIEELYDHLNHTYAGNIGAEFAHVENIEEQNFLYARLENGQTKSLIDSLQKQKILKDLIEVETFEQYLHTKFPGVKRFSIEGGEAAIILLDQAIEIFANQEASNVTLGIAHRGRLSTLTKVMQKPYRAILSEFCGKSAFPPNLNIAGDVKYHMGYSSTKTCSSGKKIHLTLSPNPSHLESVNPVIAGKVRAKQDMSSGDASKAIGILIHGDAAFCGQGVVAESLTMSGLNAYSVGGIIHIVINNQIGFTANSFDTRPGRYCTEVGKMVGAPIIHVNGEDIESVMLAAAIACEYRQKFHKDIIIDIVCYRKYGHNEGDEPKYTQSLMYNVIQNKKTPAEIYAHKLLASGVIDENFYQNSKLEFKKHLDAEYAQSAKYEPKADWLEGDWAKYFNPINDKAKTGIDKSKLQSLGKQLCTIPDDFDLHPKLQKLFSIRSEVLSKNEPIDWATAEQLSFASLLTEGTSIRCTGQDVERGTFSHRHSVLHSQTQDRTYMPLNNLSADQAKLFIADSNLSEFGVLGFEYGYSLVSPRNLVIWEAQFGDFANGAQIIMDQFISSAETKWMRLSNLVLLLPHGYEGQGPEHSSARLERFLQLSAEHNMQVVYPTTPASIFHLFRRQIHSDFRKPLIVMSPKSLLRHPLAVSKLSEIDKGTRFLEVLDEIDHDIKASSVKRVVFCSGKVYYDLLMTRRKEKIKNIAIIRLEQLYPFPNEMIKKILQKYHSAKELVWCQEEPKNMGGWKFLRGAIEDVFKDMKLRKEIHYIGRNRSASPASGYLYVHQKEQEKLVGEALNAK